MVDDHTTLAAIAAIATIFFGIGILPFAPVMTLVELVRPLTASEEPTAVG